MAPWWRPRARAEQRLSKEIAFHLSERIAELVAAGMSRRRGRSPGPPRTRAARPDPRGLPRPAMVARARRPVARRALRGAGAAPRAGLHRRRAPDADARHRRQRGAVPGLRGAGTPGAAGGRSRVAVAHPDHAGDAAQRQLHGAPGLPHLGAGGRAAPQRRRARRAGDVERVPLQHGDERRDPAGRHADGERRLLPRAGHRRPRRPAARPRRRQARLRRGQCGHQPRLLAARIRRSSEALGQSVRVGRAPRSRSSASRRRRSRGSKSATPSTSPCRCAPSWCCAASGR